MVLIEFNSNHNYDKNERPKTACYVILSLAYKLKATQEEILK